jgi:hypothetical protein
MNNSINTTGTTMNTMTTPSWKSKVMARKAALVQAAEYSDAAIEELAKNELAEDNIKTLNDLCDRMDSLLKSSGVARDWKTGPAYAYGAVNGQIARFISQFVYLPDSLKALLGVDIPTTAFTQDSVAAWGKLTRCTPLGEVLDEIKPDLANVAVQVEVLQAYLGLTYVEPVLTQEEWDAKEARAKLVAEKKAAEIRTAMIEEELNRELGVPSFTI